MRIVAGRSIAEQRASAAARIDAEAEAVRLRFLTPGAGQSAVYEAKAREAEELVADPKILPALIPHIVAEAKVRGQTNAAVAGMILRKRDEWNRISARIERLRLAAKRDIDAARTPAEIARAAAVDWSRVDG